MGGSLGDIASISGSMDLPIIKQMNEDMLQCFLPDT